MVYRKRAPVQHLLYHFTLLWRAPPGADVARAAASCNFVGAGGRTVSDLSARVPARVMAPLRCLSAVKLRPDIICDRLRDMSRTPSSKPPADLSCNVSPGRHVLPAGCPSDPND